MMRLRLTKAWELYHQVTKVRGRVLILAFGIAYIAIAAALFRHELARGTSFQRSLYLSYLVGISGAAHIIAAIILKNYDIDTEFHPIIVLGSTVGAIIGVGVIASFVSLPGATIYPTPYRSAAIIGSLGSAAGLISAFYNASLKTREKELERALDLLERTERIADVGGWEIDVNTMDVFWTDQIFKLLYIPYDEEPPLEEALDMYIDEDKLLVEDAVEKALESGESFDVEARIRTNSDNIRWLRLQGIPETVDDEVVTLRGAAQDITERKHREHRLEEVIERLDVTNTRLEKVNDDLETSNERLEQFAYAASHDLQEPLRMVSSYLKLIESRYGDKLDEDGEEFLEYAVDGADRMRDMIDGLLKFSRVETRGDEFQPVDLDDIVTDVEKNLEPKINENNAQIATDDLPVVEGDVDQLRQVFQNLLNNSLTYADDEPPRVKISAEQNGTKCIVSVEDNGIGIPPEEQERVFDMFERLHTRDDYSGTGIGLSLCQRIIERHDGEIWVDSEPGDGSTFSFTLPKTESRA